MTYVYLVTKIPTVFDNSIEAHSITAYLIGFIIERMLGGINFYKIGQAPFLKPLSRPMLKLKISCRCIEVKYSFIHDLVSL